MATSAKTFPAPPTYGATPQYPIESVDNALCVLLLLAEHPSLRMTDVGKYLGVASSTAHRLLAMLQYRGFVRQDGATRSYVPGPTLDNLAFGVLRRLDVRARARPVLERLNSDLGETIHLGRLEDSDVHFIDSLESRRALRIGSRVGWSMPAHCTSTGKALLAELTDDELMRLYPEEKLVRLTRHSIGTRTALVKALAQVKARGYARSREESEDGVSSLAIALHSTRSPRLAVNVALPVSRMTKAAEELILSRLTTAADELDHVLL